MKNNTPKGIIGIFTNPKGDVIATATIFDPIPQWQQESLARMRLAVEVARAYCAPDYARAISTHTSEAIMNDMQRTKGFTITMVPVGYNDNEKEEE